MDNEAGRSTLCYLEAARVGSPAGSLHGVQLQNEHDQVIGLLDGVVIDSAVRRLRYYVVSKPGWFRKERYLLPAERPAQMGPDEKTLRLDLSPDALTTCAPFDAGKIRHLSDEDSAASAGHAAARPAA